MGAVALQFASQTRMLPGMSDEQHPADKAPPTMTLDPAKAPGDPAAAARNIAEAIDALTSDVANLLNRVDELEADASRTATPTHFVAEDMDGMEHLVAIAHITHAWPIAEGVELQIAHGRAQRLRIPFGDLARMVGVHTSSTE